MLESYSSWLPLRRQPKPELVRIMTFLRNRYIDDNEGINFAYSKNNRKIVAEVSKNVAHYQDISRAIKRVNPKQINVVIID